MGLDAVELVMDVEEVFGIELPDEDAAHLTTPRKLIDYVCAKVSATGSERCLSQRSFYRARRILASAANIDRRAIRPSTGLDDILPRTERRRRWSELAREIGVSRRLTRPRWVIRAGVCLCALGFVGASLLVPERPLMAGSMTSAALGVLLALITRPMAFRLQVTAGALAVEAIPAVLSEGGRKGSAKWTRDGVAETCRRLIRERLGLQDFSDDAEFIRDLGMG